MFKKENDLKFDPENYTISVPSPNPPRMASIAVFDKVRVKVTVEKDKNTQRGVVKMTLIDPVDSTNL